MLNAGNCTGHHNQSKEIAMLWIALWIAASVITCWLFGRFARIGLNEF